MMTDQPTNQPTNRLIDGQIGIGKFHFNYKKEKKPRSQDTCTQIKLQTRSYFVSMEFTIPDVYISIIAR